MAARHCARGSPPAQADSARGISRAVSPHKFADAGTGQLDALRHGLGRLALTSITADHFGGYLQHGRELLMRELLALPRRAQLVWVIFIPSISWHATVVASSRR